MINSGYDKVKYRRLRSQLELEQANRPKRDKRERIMLVSSTTMKRYPVFSDIEVGITGRYQAKLNQIRFDEDNDSDDETVMAGLERSMDVLTKNLRQQKNNKTRKCSLSRPKGKKHTRTASTKSHC